MCVAFNAQNMYVFHIYTIVIWRDAIVKYVATPSAVRKEEFSIYD